MRTDKQMLDLILDIANKNKHVHAAILGGSRVNSAIKKDIFQDFDVIYIVEDIKSFIENKAFFLQFGKTLITQSSFEQKNYKNFDVEFISMMQFTDNNRLDLTLFNKEHLNKLKLDAFSKILLDKNDILKDINIPKIDEYIIKKPDEKAFYMVTNEFLWVSLYIAKGLWRRELSYAKKYYEQNLRGSLEEILSWVIGEKTNYKVSVGKAGRYLEAYLPSDIWMDYQKTYVSGSYTDIWEGLIFSIRLFKTLCEGLKKSYNYNFDSVQVDDILKHITHIRSLPANAKAFYKEL